MSDDRALTRRQAVSRALAAGAVIAPAPALGVLAAAPAAASDTPQTDGQLMYGVLAVELLVIAVYERVIASGKLSVEHALLAHRFLSYERIHARVLNGELSALGSGQPPSLNSASSSTLDAILFTKQVPESISKIGSSADALLLLMRVEEVAEGAYYHAIGKLTSPRLLLRSAEIMAAEAQHRTLLSEARDPGDIDKAVPVAFVQGRG
jgi:Ferritin-like domain